MKSQAKFSARQSAAKTSSRPTGWTLSCVLALFCAVLIVAPTLRANARQQTSRTETTAQDRSAGQRLFATSCAACHGAAGQGAGAPALLNLHLTASEVASIIANGKAGTSMPAFKDTYDSQQIADLTAYVLSLSNGARGGTKSATAASANGGAIYAARCASCHEAGGPPYLNHYVLKAADPDYIVYMLRSGTMHVQGADLTPVQRIAVAEYVTGKSYKASAATAPAALACPSTVAPGFSGPRWNGWGVDLDNSRFQPAADAGLTAEQVPNLKLKWAFGISGGFTSYSQPTVAGERVFVGDPLGGVYSLDAAQGCAYWTFHADAGVRTAIVISPGPNRLAYFGDLRANVYAVDAMTGKLVWRRKVSDHPYARITGTPRLYKGRLYVPVSSREEWMAATPSYPCCTFRGILAALDAATGKELWRTYTISDPAKPTAKNKAGTQLWGPSGAGLWSSPTIDADRQLLYIGAGNNYSDPQTPLSDAILAIDLHTGKIVWSRQLTSGDTYNVSCYRDDRSNCPAKQGPDSDFAASPVLRKLSNGQRILLVGQKSGIVFGLDPDKNGEILWQNRIGHGGPLGGVQWGPAVEDETAYVALSDFGMTGGAEGLSPDPKSGGGLFAIRLSDGHQLWAVKPPTGECTIPRCSPAQSAAVTAIPGVIFSGSDDGHVLAYSSADGKVLWDFDTVRDFDTVNKLPARGGAVDGGGPAVARGMVFVNAGYGSIYGLPGNVLLAFAPK